MSTTIDLNLVAMFVAVAEGSSFSSAGRRLRVPTSTISRGIATLESRLDAQLFVRTTRRVSLTTEGGRLLQRVAPHLAGVDAALGDLAEARAPAGVLRVTAAPDVGATFLADSLVRFNEQFPRVQVDVTVTNRFVDLVAEGFDAALRATTSSIRHSSLVARPLTAVTFHVFASPSYLDRRGTPKAARDVSDHDWIEFRGWKHHPKELSALGESTRLVADDFVFIREAIRGGAGLGLLPTFLAEPDVTAGRLVHVLPRVCQTGGRLAFVHPRAKRISLRLAVFRDFLFESAARARNEGG